MVSLEVINAILNITKPVAKNLQGIQETISTALNATASCKDVIQAFRDNEEIFVGLFRDAEGLYGESILMPRIVNQQANRANQPAVSSLHFYRRSVFLSFIDIVFEQLSERFPSYLVDCIKMQFSITSVCLKHDICFDSIRNAINFYLSIQDDSIEAVEVEFMRWRSYWLRHKHNFLPNNALNALLSAKEMETYPSLEVLLQILTTLPVYTATNGCSFSALKYLKTNLRSTMKEARLNGLALWYVHRDLKINYEHVINEFSRKNRSLIFS